MKAVLIKWSCVVFYLTGEGNWKCWCISKITYGDAICWYFVLGFKEGQKSLSNQRLLSLYAILFSWDAFILYLILLGISNIAKRERNKAAKQLDALMKVCPEFICYLFCFNTCTLNTQIKADIFRNWQFHWETTLQIFLIENVCTLMNGLLLSWHLGMETMKR